MPTVIDVNVLVALFSKNHDDLRDVRVQGLLRDTRSARGRLIIPAPALAEFAVKARDEELDFITSQKIFQIAPFDAVAALECGFMIREAFASERKEERRKIKLICRSSRLRRSAERPGWCRTTSSFGREPRPWVYRG